MFPTSKNRQKSVHKKSRSHPQRHAKRHAKRGEERAPSSQRFKLQHSPLVASQLSHSGRGRGRRVLRPRGRRLRRRGGGVARRGPRGGTPRSTGRPLHGSGRLFSAKLDSSIVTLRETAGGNVRVASVFACLCSTSKCLFLLSVSYPTFCWVCSVQRL